MMSGRTAEELREELLSLLGEQIECLKKQTFGGIDEEEFFRGRQRLKRIREVSADFILALKREDV